MSIFLRNKLSCHVGKVKRCEKGFYKMTDRMDDDINTTVVFNFSLEITT